MLFQQQCIVGRSFRFGSHWCMVIAKIWFFKMSAIKNSVFPKCNQIHCWNIQWYAPPLHAAPPAHANNWLVRGSQSLTKIGDKLLITLVIRLTKELADSILWACSCCSMTHWCRWWMSFALFSLSDTLNALLHSNSSRTNASQTHCIIASLVTERFWPERMKKSNPIDSLRFSAGHLLADTDIYLACSCGRQQATNQSVSSTVRR